MIASAESWAEPRSQLYAAECECSLLNRLLRVPDVDVQAEVLESLDGTDFGDERNAVIFRAAQELKEHGAPVEFESVMEHLRREDALTLAGETEHFATILRATPTLNLSYHTNLIQGYSLRRKMREALSRGIVLTEALERDVAEVSHEVERLVLAAGERKAEADSLREMGTYLAAFMDVMERTETGLTWGLDDLDYLTRGLRSRRLYVIMARPSMGKAQPFWEKVLTPSGWVEMGSLNAGDRVIGMDGQPRAVLAVYPQGQKEVFRVTFGDGGWTYCCADHFWTTTTRNERRREVPVASVKTTRKIAETIRRPDRQEGANHCIPLMQPAELEQKGERPLDAYWLGLWIGDGDTGSCIRFTNPENDLQEAFVRLLPPNDTATINGMYIRVRGQGTNGSDTMRTLRALGLAGRKSGEKFIPSAYKFSPIEERLALLRGILDTDGYVHPSGVGVEWCTASGDLAEDVEFVVGSLGGITTKTYGPAHYTVAGERHTAQNRHRLNIYFPSGICPVSSAKHLAKWRSRQRCLGGRTVRAVEPAGAFECQCITVEGSHYITSNFAVTHNSAHVQGVGLNAAINEGRRVAFFSVENGEEEWLEAAFAWSGSFDMHSFRLILSSDRPDLARGAAEFTIAAQQLKRAASKLHLDTTSRTAPQMLRRARRMKRSGGLDLIVVDHIHEMDGPGDNEERKVAKVARDLKAMAKELDVPVLTAGQLNRKCEDRPDKRPHPSDGRASGGIEEAADTIGLLYRPEYYFGPYMKVGKGKNEQSVDVRGYTEWIIGKNRGGPRQFREKDHVKMFFRAEAVRFESYGGRKDG